jgi:hypothetical protein
MRPKQNGKQAMSREKNRPIRTTFMELIEELTNLTRDDALVLAAVRDIFGTYRVRLADPMAPVRLLGAQRPMTRYKRQRGQRLPSWA